MTPAIGATTTTTVNCTNTCSTTMTVPVGLDQFTVNLYDAGNGNGNLLATGTTKLQVLASQPNTLSLVFNGVIASLSIAYDYTKLVAGTASTIPLAVVAKDGSGAAIIGPDPYTTPITLTDTDTTGVLKLSATTLNTPADAINLIYSGGIVNSVTVGAAVGAVSTSIVVNAGAPGGNVGVNVPVPGPSVAGIPAHVLTYLYYGAGNTNTNVPASFMAAHADFAEMSEQQTSIAAAFKSAGGRFAIVYTDPTFQAYCVAPFTVPAGTCLGPISQLITSESGYYHDATGSRIYKLQTGSYYQEALNLGSASAQGAYRQFTQNLVNLAAGIDLFFADDSGSTYTNGSGTSTTGFLYGFSAPAVEVTSDATYISQEKAMLASPVRPVIINGGDVSTWLPAYNGTFITAPNVRGENREGCFNWWLGLQGDANNYWVQTANTLLATTAAQRYAICMMMGTANPVNRMYQLASWWMTYDPNWSAAGPIAPASDGYAVFPEYDIVPTGALRSAATDISVLRSSASGPYVREFSACYQKSGALGACAAVVNTTGGTLAMPALSRSYTHALVLNDASSFTTGTASWTGSVPASLGAMTAVVLLQ